MRLDNVTSLSAAARFFDSEGIHATDHIHVEVHAYGVSGSVWCTIGAFIRALDEVITGAECDAILSGGTVDIRDVFAVQRVS